MKYAVKRHTSVNFDVTTIRESGVTTIVATCDNESTAHTIKSMYERREVGRVPVQDDAEMERIMEYIKKSHGELAGAVWDGDALDIFHMLDHVYNAYKKLQENIDHILSCARLLRVMHEDPKVQEQEKGRKANS